MYTNNKMREVKTSTALSLGRDLDGSTCRLRFLATTLVDVSEVIEIRLPIHVVHARNAILARLADAVKQIVLRVASSVVK